MRAALCVLLLFLSARVYAAELDLRLPEWEYFRPAAEMNGLSVKVTVPVFSTNLKQWQFGLRSESFYSPSGGSRQTVLDTKHADPFGELSSSTVFNASGFSTQWRYKTNLQSLAWWYQNNPWAKQADISLSALYSKSGNLPVVGAKTITASIPLVRKHGFTVTASVSTVRGSSAVYTECRYPDPCLSVQAVVKLF